jgi:hypothetical protein
VTAGIGFKSVFSICNYAVIKSKALCVAFGNSAVEPSAADLVLPKHITPDSFDTQLRATLAQLDPGGSMTHITLFFKPEVDGKNLTERIEAKLTADLLVPLRFLERICVRRDENELLMTRTEVPATSPASEAEGLSRLVAQSGVCIKSSTFVEVRRGDVSSAMRVRLPSD